MCSRYSLTSPHESVRQTFRYVNAEPFPPRFKIAPTEPVGIVRLEGPARERTFALVRWGLIPSWAKDPARLSTLINARGETVAEKPAFRGAMRHRRCLVPADGFYEWTGPPRQRTPHLIRRRDRGLMAFAGLWEHWLGADGSEIETMAIVTVAANGDVAPYHDRMPALLPEEAFDAWLDCSGGDGRFAAGLLAPAHDGLLDVTAMTKDLSQPVSGRTDQPIAVREPRLL